MGSTVNGSPNGHAPPPPLTTREADILRLLATGRTAAEVAADLGTSADAVQAHLRAAMVKLGARSKLEAIIKAVRAGLIRLDE
jgi:DNA-binding CsgD family transcriptional regulator